MKLVSDWKNAYKWLSVVIPAFGTLLLASWMAVPDSMRNTIPHRYVEAITIVIFVAGVIGRLIQQTPSVPPVAPAKKKKK